MSGLIIRIFKQMKNDKRTLAMIFVVPLVINTFLFFLLGDTQTDEKVMLLNANNEIEAIFNESEHCELVPQDNEKSPEEILKDGDADVVIDFAQDSKIYLLEQNPSTLKEVKGIMDDIQKDVYHQSTMEVEYVYGNNLNTTFEELSYVLLGVICFFLVFLISGISLVRERTMGTLERFMLTPISRPQVILGYTIGFGVFGVIQSVIILLFVHYILGLKFEGSLLWALVIMVVLALSAVSLGTFVSIFANSEFQVIQFIPVIIIPQIFFSGILPLNGLPLNLEILGYIMPVYYGSNALKKVVVNGQGFGQIKLELLMLVIFCVFFYILNVFSLKKYRAL